MQAGSIDVLERWNKEIKRGSNVVGIFPSAKSTIAWSARFCSSRTTKGAQAQGFAGVHNGGDGTCQHRIALRAIPEIFPGTRLGSYTILTALGAGGMGQVYRAHDDRLGRDVAVKVLPPALSTDADALARFEREARAVAALSHPNILSIYDLGSSDGIVFAVMELLEGETLRSRLETSPPSPRKAIDFAVQIARALAGAHDKGIVHRDLKPENVMITRDGRVKVLDFGLARLLEFPHAAASSETRTGLKTADGVVLGTVGYISPEQVRGLSADHRSDIFSFGVVLYELLSGRRPFAGDSAVETMNAILGWSIHRDSATLSAGPRQSVITAGVRVARTPPRAPFDRPAKTRAPVLRRWRRSSPAGKRSPFSGHRELLTKGFIQDIADGKRRAFAPEGVNTSSFAALPITPDGTAAWLLGPDGQSYLYPVAGGDPKPLRGVQPNENLVRWSAEGRELFVSSPTGTPQRIYRIDLATGVRTVWKEVTPLQPAGVRLSQITVTPDGRALLHSYAQLLTNLYVVTGLASSPRR